METLILVFRDSDVALNDVAEWLRPSQDVTLHDHLLVARLGEDTVYIVRVDDPVADGVYDDWGEEPVPDYSSSIFSLDYRSPDAAIAVVRLLHSASPCVVNTNFGRIVDGSQLMPDMLRR